MPLDEATGVRGVVVFCWHLSALIVRHQAHKPTKKKGHSRDLVFGFVSFHELCVLPKFLVTRQLTLLAGVQRRNARLFARQDFGRPYPVGQAELPIEAMRSLESLGRPRQT